MEIKQKLILFYQKLCVVKANTVFLIMFSLYISVIVFLDYQKDLHHWIVSIGHILQIAIPLYVLVPVLWKKDFKGLKQMLKIFAIVLGITWSFKLGLSQLLGVHYIRPSGGTMSFPSGHTAAAFSGAIFLSIRYGWKYFVVFIPLALFVGWSRIYGNAHWPSDVAASIILCVISCLFFVNRHKVECYL